MKWKWICKHKGCKDTGRKFIRYGKANKHIRKHYSRLHPNAKRVVALFVREDGRKQIFEEDIINDTNIRGKIQAKELGTSSGTI